MLRLLPIPSGLFVALCLTSWSAAAQFTEIINSDRPCQANTPYVVGQGVVQYQTGLDLLRIKDSPTHTSGQLYGHVLRYGLTDNWELNAQGDYLKLRITNGELTTDVGAWSSVQVGLRRRMWEQKTIRPKSTASVRIHLPVGGALATEKPVFDVLTIHQWVLPHQWTLTINAGWAKSEITAHQWRYVVNASHPLGKILCLYLEGYGDYSQNLAQHKWDAGFTIIPHRNIQLDLFGGLARNRGKSEMLISTGLSWRILPRSRRI
jgi:hypothetical protein